MRPYIYDVGRKGLGIVFQEISRRRVQSWCKSPKPLRGKPALTAFRSGTYLKVPVVTTLTAANVGSQYRLAALAFDRHVAHLVRLPYFKSASGFEGITFRTTVSAGASPAESVEFLFPLAELRRYENDDC